MSGAARWWMPMALMASAVAGCVGDPQEPLAPAGADESLGETIPAAPVVQEWTGHLVVGAGDDLPAHFPETAPLAKPLMDAMVNFEIMEVPEALAFELVFTSADLVQAQLMLNGPFRAQGWKEWVTAKSDAATHCVRIAPEALEPGLWYAMPHSTVAVNAEFTVRAVMTGGMGRFVQDYARWPSLAETLAAQPFLAHQEPLPCEEAGS